MRPQKVNTEALIMGALSVLKEKGFDGSSLNELEKATGLKKASLYHRFPGGKEEIVQSVFQFMEDWIARELVNTLKDTRLSSQERVNRVLKNIDTLYKGGNDVCFIRSLSMGTGKALFEDSIKRILNIWLEAFTHFGEEIGLEKEKAIEKAKNSLMLIQGSLVLAHALDQPECFKNALKQVKKSYTI